MIKPYLQGAGLFIGLIFGAGIFALPFVVIKAGLFWGIVHFTVTFLLILFFHLLYADIACSVEGKHRFIGYAGLILGKRARQAAFIVTVVTYYGGLLVYGILGGIFISNFFNNYSPFFFTISFFAVGGILVFFKLDKIASVNFYLTIPLIGFAFYLFFVCFPHINFDNFSFGEVSPFKNAFWFLPYGVWVFSLSGLGAVPQARDLFCVDKTSALKSLRRLILLSSLLIVFCYWLFIFSVVGISGISTTEDTFSGMSSVLGGVTLLGSLIGFLAVFTSFLALAADLRDNFHLDLKIPRAVSWSLAVFPPFLMFLFGVKNLMMILQIVGTFGLGFTGMMIIFMARKIRYSAEPKIKSKIIAWVEVLAGIAILSAVILELWRLI